MDIPHEKRFHFRDGSSVGSLEELKEKIQGISYQEFYHHVNADKNDFANWVQHVLKEEELAGDLQRVSSIVETVEILNDFIHPPPVMSAGPDLQRKIEEEALHIHVPTAHEVQSSAPETPQEPADFEQIAEEFAREIPPSDAKPAQEAIHAGEHVLSEHDYTRLIVKDFMYGLVFGLIIGIILGRILSF